jgi:cytochrome b561
MTMISDRIGPVRGYSAFQIGLHWLIAALVLVQLVFGESMTEFVEAAEEGEPVSALDANLAGVHYYFGIAILALVAVRLALRFGRGAPPAPEASRALELAGRVSHWLFYALLVVTPITGLLGYYFGDPFGEIHELAKPVFIGLIALHVAASLLHQFWLKDGLLMRMLRPQSL